MAEVMSQVRELPVWAAGLLVLLENSLILAVGLLLGTLILKLPSAVRIMPDPGRTSGLQRWLALSTVLLNSAVTLAGWKLWTMGVIRVSFEWSWTIVPQLLGLFLIMDLTSYTGHAIAHLRPLFPLAHRLHHRFVDARPLTLFALHPLEVIGFGAIWIAVLSAFSFSFWAVTAYSAVNLIFGVFGHLGVEPIPASIRRSPIFFVVATPTMHAMHHANPARNLGFYTTIWDRLFGTLDPAYDRQRMAAVPPALALAG